VLQINSTYFFLLLIKLIKLLFCHRGAGVRHSKSGVFFLPPIFSLTCPAFSMIVITRFRLSTLPFYFLHQFLAYHTYPKQTSLQKRISDCHKEKEKLAKKGKEITYFYVDASPLPHRLSLLPDYGTPRPEASPEPVGGCGVL
jgi:hypothetical protein